MLWVDAVVKSKWFGGGGEDEGSDERRELKKMLEWERGRERVCTTRAKMKEWNKQKQKNVPMVCWLACQPASQPKVENMKLVWHKWQQYMSKAYSSRWKSIMYVCVCGQKLIPKACSDHFTHMFCTWFDQTDILSSPSFSLSLPLFPTLALTHFTVTEFMCITSPRGNYL